MENDATPTFVVLGASIPVLKPEECAFIEPTIADNPRELRPGNAAVDVIHMDDTAASNCAVLEVPDILVFRNFHCFLMAQIAFVWY